MSSSEVAEESEEMGTKGRPCAVPLTYARRPCRMARRETRTERTGQRTARARSIGEAKGTHMLLKERRLVFGTGSPVRATVRTLWTKERRRESQPGNVIEMDEIAR